MKKYVAFTLKAHGGRFREIHTDVQISLPMPSAGMRMDDSRLVKAKALWDTGATNSSITASLAKKLGLVPISFTDCHHAQGTTRVPVYLVNLYLPNSVSVEALRVSEIADTLGGFDVLIGMDIITLGDFAITNEGGTTTVSFRIPSIKEIDFVVEHQKLAAPLEDRMKAIPKPSKNAPCPCGSGKIYKRCCGRKAA